jgi:hypothetical protein
VKVSQRQKFHVNNPNKRFNLKKSPQKVFVHFFQKVVGCRGNAPHKKVKNLSTVKNEIIYGFSTDYEQA